MRIVVIGISGTGKSILAQELARKIGLPLFQMDSIIWSENWTETPEDTIRKDLEKIAATERWIVEGWVDAYSREILEKADHILYLDYPGYLAAWGGLKRAIQYIGKRRPEMPEGCITTLDLSFLKTMFFRKERPHIEKIIGPLPSEKIFRTKSRRQARQWISTLTHDQVSGGD